MSTTPAVTAEPAAQQPANESPTLGAILAKAFTAVKGKVTVATELASLQTQLNTVTGERDTARTERDQARTERDNAVGQMAAVAAFFGVKAEELAGKDAKACAELFAKKVSDVSLEQVASMGVPAADLPKAKAEGTGASTDELMAEYNAMPNATAEQAEAKAEFYKKHFQSGKN